MLILSRKLNETIVIGDGITVTLVDIDRGRIKLGIEAPADVPIYRKELLDRANGKLLPLPPALRPGQVITRKLGGDVAAGESNHESGR